ncbi:PREDICTED: uncharacterized protein LOC109584022 [Amphimedon queenslandica]|uniref:Death domain-containing protein n=1 Tax=Amphimedon queenslandica TaxID=400682 RepID=A0A1X7UCD9_AMPQE|nr:PREDICTED: uncharacterized protein LOC109584022 [Amphimedon queenslandica]|eukprot:XP_019855143.1 PREDICTED: uncharacterized protein LOC109584022 [Amphimedon queenslandica]
MESPIQLRIDLSVKDLLTFLTQAVKNPVILNDKWKDLGEGLGLDQEALSGISSSRQPEEYLEGCLSLWYESKGERLAAPFTWEALLIALNKTGEAQMAIDIYFAVSGKGVDGIGESDFLKSLDEALKEGSVKTRWTKFAVSGPSGSGKTSSIKLLLGEEPVIEYLSTDVIEAAKIRAYNIMAENDSNRGRNIMWREISSLEDIVSNDSPEMDKLTEDIDGLKLSKEKASSRPSLNKIVHFIYAIDTGGQAAFLDIAPALMRHNSVTIVTHKLDEDLEDKVKFSYCLDHSEDRQHTYESSEHQITHRQLLESLIRPSHMTNKPQLDMIKAKHYPPDERSCFIILGTNFDKISNDVDKVKEKSTSLSATLKQFDSDRKISVCKYNVKQQGGASTASYIFPINAIDRGPDTLNIAKIVRRQVSKSYIEADIPKSWFSFHKRLVEGSQEPTKESMEANKNVVSLEECKRIGLELKMNMKEVEAALMYYHSLTVILYYPEIIPDVVFLKPQPLFKKLSQIVFASFSEAPAIFQDEFDIDLPGDAQHNLSTKGTFKKDLLDELEFLDEFEDLYTSADLINLMIKLLIIVKLPMSDHDPDEQYFLPSVLPICDPAVKAEEFKKHCHVSPLLIGWEKVIPQGFFCALILRLLQHKDFASESFLRDRSGGNEIKQYRNVVKLPCKSTKGGKVLLIDGINILQIHYNGDSKNCFELRKTLMEVIDFVDQEYSYNLGQLSCSFFSRHEECATVKSSLNEDMVLSCTRSGCDQAPYGIDQQCELPWIKQETPLAQQSATKDLELDPKVQSVLDKAPKLTHLQHIFLKYSEKYFIIGAALEVEADGSLIGTKIMLNDIFKKWKDSGKNVFWRTMLQVCKDFETELGRAKSDLLQFLVSPRAQEEYS